VGGLVGALVGMGIPEFEAKCYDSRLKDGAILLAVHCASSEEVCKAREVLEAGGAQDIASCAGEYLDHEEGSAPTAAQKGSLERCSGRGGA
jgi:predicted nicotinamide N-methyase